VYCYRVFSESLQHYTKMPVQIWSADRAIVCSANALFTTAPAANYNSHYLSNELWPLIHFHTNHQINYPTATSCSFGAF